MKEDLQTNGEAQCADAQERPTMSAEHLLRLRDRQIETSRKAWVRAAEAALTLLPGASNSSHPAHGLWLRVEMAKMPPMEVVLSSAKQVPVTDPGMNPPLPSGEPD